MKQDLAKVIEPVERDLEEIRTDGKLKALTTYNATSYFLYRGEPMGFEYELLKRFAEYLDLELEIIISRNIDSLFYELNIGEADIVAHDLTVTANRQEEVLFTDYLYLTHQVLVQRKPQNWRQLSWSQLQRSLIHDAIELIGDTVSVRQNSSFLERLENLSQEIGGEIIIDTLPGYLSTDEIIKMVVDGEIKYTVADDNLAQINASYYPELNVDVPISFSQRIAWAVRPTSPDLLETANEWLAQQKKEVDYYVIYNKYFKNEKGFRQRIGSDLLSLNTNRISSYDELIKKYADEIGWDWRLLAAVIYQESRFNPKAGSWAGAEGLMQLMQSTAREYDVKNRLDPEQSIRGGARYLGDLYDKLPEVTDSVQRIKLTLAAYNGGFYHLLDARNLAEKHDLDPNTWDDNVAEMVLNLSYPRYYNDPVVKYGYLRGIEPYNYVEQVFEHFEHYQNFIND